MERGGTAYQIRQCLHEACRFRFPAVEGAGAQCPQCGTETAVAAVPHTKRTAPLPPLSPRQPIEVLLDNIRSLYNVGAIFRTADGAGISHLHLCGITATPEHPKLAKTALGADSQMGWHYYRNGLDTAAALHSQGYHLWALEDSATARPLFDARSVNDGRPILLIVGNENVGVDPAILALCEQVLYLPMHGVKESLNVAVAFGIAIYHLQFGGISG